MIGPSTRHGGVDIVPEMPLGQALVGKGLLSQEQLDQALARQQEHGHDKLLGEVLVDMGVIEQDAIAEALAESWGVPFVAQPARTADPASLESLPREFVEEHAVLPLFKVRNTLTVAVSDPADLWLVEETARLSGAEVQVAVSSKDEINNAIRAYLPAANVFVIDDIYEDLKEEDFSVVERQATELADLEEVAGHGPVVKLVNYMVFSAVQEGASDIHIEPEDHRLRVRFRVDGRLYERLSPPHRMHAAIASRVKILSNLDISERRVPQDGDCNVMIEGRPIDLRVSTMPGKYGEKVVIRIIDSRNARLGLDQLGFGLRMLESWKRVVEQPNGIALVTGPTGSGKSTTLYSVLQSISTDEMNISTIEDPVEARIPGINQAQVNTKAGFTFAGALRAMLRQDPDIMMVGEVRDSETAGIVTQAALTGHLVFSTLHTNDAPSAVTRMVNLGVEPYLVAATLRGVLAQRLVRKICPHCKAPMTCDDRTTALIAAAGGDPTDVHAGAGCTRCRNTGYAGRLGIFELMVPEGEVLD
ncbi:MAG: GspE/PulE family protein, partial [Phycisphaerales bacterium]|nr:GspE/PulE family protein [Phycisphaerales bacterium]